MNSKVLVVGTGYVVLLGACFSEVGIPMVCIDIDKEKIENLKRLFNLRGGLEFIVERT